LVSLGREQAMNKNRLLNMAVVAALVLTALPLAQPAQAESSGPELSRDMQFVPGEAVVGFESEQDSGAYTARATALANQVDAQVVSQDGNLALLSFSPDADVTAAVEKLSAQDGVAFAEPNYIAYSPDVVGGSAIPVMGADYQTDEGGTFTLTADMLRSMRTEANIDGVIQSVPTYPNDSSNNWSWVKVGSDIIWPDKSANPVVCVVDTGVDANHPDLMGYVINGKDYVNSDAVPADDNGHGTHLAGIIAARMNNGASTVAGISTGKILAVKVLNSQGVGSAYKISLGIKYCANNGAKIINLSLGSYSPSQAEYDALNYAEGTKGLLVVAAAGNDSKSAPFFPAAWASSKVCKDGTAAPCDGTKLDSSGNPTNTPNQLASGLMSVAAARSLQTKNSGPKIWVDDGDGSETAGEDRADCATSFSNYGKWVSMVAPGEDILSTTPVSNPFYLNTSQGVQSGYDALSGTSMAAAHVSGAAARVWSIGASLFGTTPTRQKVKSQLVTWGKPLTQVQDPGWNDSANGYNGGGFTGDAPFCWPNSMSSATYLNVAKAMERMSIGAVLVVKANTSGALAGAKVTVNAKGSSTILDTSIVPSSSPFVDLLNIPANVTKTYEVKVSLSGYTSGVVKIGDMVVKSSMSGLAWSGNNISIAIPKNNGITVVATWFNKQAYLDQGQLRDLDFYMWIPKTKCSTTWPHTASIPCIVGPKDSPAGLTDYAWFGSLAAKPFARSFFDGGSSNLSPAGTIPVGAEAITIKATSVTTAPYLKPYYAGTYAFVLTGSSNSELHDPKFPVRVSVWIKGKPYVTIQIPACSTGDAWKALTINALTYKVGSTSTSCKDFGSFWPYR
jgi:subtilisin family serine protease